MNVIRSFLLLIIFNTFLLYAQADTLHPGILYEHIVTDDPNQSIYVAYIDPKQAELVIDIAGNKSAGAKRTSDMAQSKNALIAINGSFWDFKAPNNFLKLCIKGLDALGFTNYTTIPVYSLKINGKWFSISSRTTGIIGWSHEKQQAFYTTAAVHAELVINGKQYPVRAFNKPYRTDPAIYSSVYGKRTPRKSQSHVEVVIENDKVQRILPTSHGRTPIPENGFVYSFYKTSLDCNPDAISENDDVSFTLNFESDNADFDLELWNSMDYIMGSTPLLLKDGTIIPDIANRTSSFYIKRHARTAVGIQGDGTWVLVVVDGKQKSSVGFTMLELAEFMKEKGCQQALNLDGGGSSTMAINGKVVNTPSGHEWSIVKKERPISHALLVLPKE